MEIKTKYEIGQHIWIAYEDRGEVSVYDTWIESISYEKDGLIYFTKELNDYPEEAIILYKEKDKLLERIETIMKQIHAREDKNNENIRH
jgi:hypothetical protein